MFGINLKNWHTYNDHKKGNIKYEFQFALSIQHNQYQMQWIKLTNNIKLNCSQQMVLFKRNE